MIYIFVFLGEFGYELLNWQGVIRKFSDTLRENDKIVVVSRKGVALLYETADLYIDLSEIELYSRSIASGYRANDPEIKIYRDYDRYSKRRFTNGVYSIRNMRYERSMKRQIQSYVEACVNHTFGRSSSLYYVFSDRYTVLHGLRFGRKHRDPHDIYAKLDLANNRYRKLIPDSEHSKNIEKRFGISREENYILCQMGERSIVRRSKEACHYEDVIQEIAKKRRVVLLDFSTGRNRDSGSGFDDIVGCKRIVCHGLEEQSVWIADASCCVFFTEGDFRSHNYLPPFFGKNVYSVADSSVYGLPTTPIDFWNRNVFAFGGQIIPVYSDRLSEQEYSRQFYDAVFSESAG